MPLLIRYNGKAKKDFEPKPGDLLIQMTTLTNGYWQRGDEAYPLLLAGDFCLYVSLSFLKFLFWRVRDEKTFGSDFSIVIGF